MKRLTIAVILLCIMLISITGCGNRNSLSNSNSYENENGSVYQNQEAEKQEILDSAGIAYQVPNNAFSIDMSSEDPSNSDIQFSYDDENRITLCTYKIDDSDIRIVYSYTDDRIQIYAFSGDILAAYETFSIAAYDNSVGFTVHQGYYFRGCKF